MSQDSKLLAIHGVIGIDFFDVKSGERLYHMLASQAAIRGRFFRTDYVAYGLHGFVRRYSPELGLELRPIKPAMAGRSKRSMNCPITAASSRFQTTRRSWPGRSIRKPHRMIILCRLS